MLDIRRIPFDSPLYPLPSNYLDLTKDGQRRARVNACRQWALDWPTKEEKARAYLGSMDFFDHYYLWDDVDDEFFPMFYTMAPREIADGHRLIQLGWVEKYSVAVAPRGYAKSFLNYKDMLMRMSSMKYSYLYATSTMKNVSKCASTLRVQFATNRRLNDDFAPSYGVSSLRPPRSSGRNFGTEYFELENGSSAALYSVKSKQRGGRVNCYVLDDPEFDPDGETSLAMLREYMHRLIFKIAMPMLTQPGTSMRWIGTFVSQKHYLWSAMQVDPNSKLAEIPSFNRWRRIFVPAEIKTDTGVVSAWPTVWPLTVADKYKLAETDSYYKEAVSLEEMKIDMTVPVYNNEMLGQPGVGEHQHFKPFTKELHGYWYEEADASLTEDPRSSDSLICFYDINKETQAREIVKMPMKDFLGRARLFICVDTAYTHTSDSDYKVANLMAYYPGNLLFCLDLWAGKSKPETLINETFQMAQKWRCPSVHVEHIKDGILVYNSLKSKAATAARDTLGYTHVPKIEKILVGMTEKGAKINAALTMRMEYGTIKLPLSLKAKSPWRELFEQIECFNPDLEGAGLRKDDHIDTLAMHMYVLRASLARHHAPITPLSEPLERIKQGHYHTDDGIPIGMGVDWRKVPLGDIMEIIANSRKRSEEAGSYA